MRICLIADNIRSSENVGSLLRVADGLGIDELYLCGISPYPLELNELRLAHIANKNHRRIAKTALGAENSQKWSYVKSTVDLINRLKSEDWLILALEQNYSSIPITDFKLEQPVALIIGNEIDGVDSHILQLADQIIEIPMQGHKESFNVSTAAAMALFYLQFMI